MREMLYKQDNVVTTEYDSDLQAVVVTWTNLGPHAYLRPAIEAQIQCLKNKGKSVIVDTGKATGVPSQEDQAWFGEYVFPEMQKIGNKAVITVLPASALGKLAAGQWNRTGQQFGMDFIDVATTADAMTVAKEYL